MKIQKKNFFFFIFFFFGWGGGQVGVCSGWGSQGGCEQRIEVFVNIHFFFFFFFFGGGGLVG